MPTKWLVYRKSKATKQLGQVMAECDTRAEAVAKAKEFRKYSPEYTYPIQAKEPWHKW